MTFALAAPSFNQVTETFIADHARFIAPGRTVLICNDSRGAEAFGYPVLSHLQSGFMAFGPRDAWLKDKIYRARRRFGPALGFLDRMRLAEFLDAQGVRVALAEYGFTGAMLGRACEALGIPLYVYFHGVDASALLREATTRRRYRRMFSQVAGVICVSRALARGLTDIGCPERLIHILPCGVDPGRFPQGAPEPGRVMALGRLVGKKAPHVTIRAFGAAAARIPEAHLDLVGDGPLRAQCDAVIAELGLADRVTMHGTLDYADYVKLMRRASLFVQHSVTAPNGDTEGFPVSIMEAMSTGLPVVSTLHSGIPEGVDDGVTGLLVAEGDTAAMGTAMTELLADPARATAMGAAGRERVLSHFTQADSISRLRTILDIDGRTDTHAS